MNGKCILLNSLRKGVKWHYEPNNFMYCIWGICVLCRWGRMWREEGVQGGLVALQAEDGVGGNLGYLTKLESWSNGDLLRDRQWK